MLFVADFLKISIRQGSVKNSAAGYLTLKENFVESESSSPGKSFHYSPKEILPGILKIEPTTSELLSQLSYSGLILQGKSW